MENMPKRYSQWTAMRAITIASLRATFKSPQSIFFSLFFPIVLIMIFGSLSKGGGGASVDVALDKNADTLNTVYFKMKNSPLFHFEKDGKDMVDELKKGRITAILNIVRDSGRYDINIKTSTASGKNMPFLLSALNGLNFYANRQIQPDPQTVATLSYTEIKGAREQYKMIDFMLPGMIGFSLIGAAVFGVAFVFYSMRETLVLKRLYSTPIKKHFIILGESLARVIFQLMTVAVLVLFGRYVYGFTLAHGFLTFLDMMVLSFLALVVFMGFGFFISSVAKNQHVIPIYANLFMFPQYFLSGTFFPKEALPQFMQPIIKYLPLTAVNDAIRKVSFEGVSLMSCWTEMLTLAVWGIVIYVITVRVFRWE